MLLFASLGFAVRPHVRDTRETYALHAHFLATHTTNATQRNATQHTNYFFDVNAGHLDGALDVFSRFFVDPLFTEGATGRELTAIDNENSKNLNSDPWRLIQVCVEGGPWKGEGSGQRAPARVCL